MMSSMILTVKLYEITKGRRLIDTAAFNINIVRDETRPEYLYNLPLRVQEGMEYMAEIKILDRLRMQVIQSFVPFNTNSDFNRYSFRVQGHFMKNLLFNPVLKENEYVNIVYQKSPIDSLFISYYKPIEGVPDPPSLLLPEKTINYEPDTVMALAYSAELPVAFPVEGVYQCSVDRKISEGFTFFNFGTSYPETNTPETMIEPLGYLASADEMAAMRSSTKPKVSLDEFWINCGGNVEKSRELIRIYYTRVLYSNYYFTSFKEGWRTERGMVYIVYGPPDKVYKTTDGEMWGYRKPVVRSSWGGRFRVKEDYLFFTFRIRNSLYSDNDFYVSRTETLVTQWDQAVASWRKGIVFRFDNPGDI
ncbi:MAG TPA: GWxTD domain-containing protein, partial [Bacteroidales bacterium]|nr:GWxTD domain-containing protein [Bacteroidales bacterium]